MNRTIKRILAGIGLALGLAAAAHAASPSTWSGGGTDAFWNNAANWGGNLPVPGATYNLIFSNANLRVKNTNDFAAGSSFSNITFAAGASAHTLSGNSITLNGTIANSSSSAQTINNDLIFNTTRSINASSQAITLNGTISGAGGLTKIVTGATLILNGSNTFTGPVTLGNGTTTIKSFNSVVGGTAYSSLGAPTTVANGTISLGGYNQGVVAGTVKYTGAGETTDRMFKLVNTAGGRIEQAGTGLLKFTGDVSISTATNTSILRLQGSTAGTGEFAGIIAGGSAATNALSVEKSGTGLWTLSGNNTYVGGTTVMTGTLVGAASGCFGTGGMTVADAAALILQSADTLDNQANIILGSSSSLAMDFTGSDTVAGISLDGGTTWLSAGTYDASTLSGIGSGTYAGTGSLTVIPEPATISLFVISATGLLLLRRRMVR